MVQPGRATKMVSNEVQEYRNVIGKKIVEMGYSREDAVRCLDRIMDQSPGYLKTLGRALLRARDSKIGSGHIRSFINNGWLPAQPSSQVGDGARAASSGQAVASAVEKAGGRAASPAPANEDRVYDQVKIHGRQGAITVHAVWSKNEPKTLEGFMFDFAEVAPDKPKINGMNQFQWERKIIFSASDVESVPIVLVLLGRTPYLQNIVQSKLKDGSYGYDKGLYHQKGAFKKLNVEIQKDRNGHAHVYMSISSNQDAPEGKVRTIGVPIGTGDRIKLAGWMLSRLRHSHTFKGMNASDILAVGSAVLKSQ